MVLFTLDPLVYLFAMNRDVFGRVDSNTDLVALDAQYSHGNFVADHHRLADTPGQYQHNRAPCFVGVAAAAFIALSTATPSSVVRGSSGDQNTPPQEFFRLMQRIKTIVTTGYQKKQTVQLARRLRIRVSTPASAFSKFSGCVPPAWAKSARPPPLPPTCAATAPAMSPAFMRANRSADTPATNTTLPSCTVASTITEEPSLLFRLSTASRNDLASAPSICAAKTLIPSTSFAWEVKSPPWPLASLDLSCCTSFSSLRARSTSSRTFSSTSSRLPRSIPAISRNIWSVCTTHS